MRKTIFAAATAFILLSQGCALFKPMTPEERAAWEKRMAAERLEAQREARMKENDGMELIGGDVHKAALAAEAIMRENGYTTSSTTFTKGPGTGVSVGGTRKSNRDLGTTIGTNIVGNMLGADRSRIIRSKEESTIVWIWPKWNSTYTAAEPGRLLFANAGGSHEINQGGQKVNEKTLNLSEITFLRDAIQGRLK